MLEWIKTWLRNYFGFSKAEIHGTLVLLLLCCLCLIVPQGLKWYYGRQSSLVNHDQDIALLEHTLALLEAQKQSPKPVKSKQKKDYCPSQSLLTFDINTASEAQLSTIQGLGPVLSARIVKFRDKLGGFVSQAQYQEVYGLLPEVVDRLKQYTYISVGFKPKKLDINTANAQMLATHPYITDQQARSIVHYRAQRGPFTMVEVLNGIVFMDEATSAKILPYLTVTRSTLVIKR